LGDKEEAQGDDYQRHRQVLKQDTDTGQVVADFAVSANLTVLHLVYLTNHRGRQLSLNDEPTEKLKEPQIYLLFVMPGSS
jgi:hypothetical protein